MSPPHVSPPPGSKALDGRLAWTRNVRGNRSAARLPIALWLHGDKLQPWHAPVLSRVAREQLSVGREADPGDVEVSLPDDLPRPRQLTVEGSCLPGGSIVERDDLRQLGEQ